MGYLTIKYNTRGERQADNLGQDKTRRSQKTNAPWPYILDHGPTDALIEQKTRHHKTCSNTAAL